MGGAHESPSSWSCSSQGTSTKRPVIPLPHRHRLSVADGEASRRTGTVGRVNARTYVLITAACALLSCSGASTPPADTATVVPAPAGNVPDLATPGDRAPIPEQRMLKPLTALGPCEDVPQGEPERDVAGLVLPDDAVVTSVTDADPLTNVQGYIPMTPVQIRVFYQQHPDLTVVSVEDEGFEAEVLSEVDGYRTFVKAQAVCELGSVFVAVISPAAAKAP